MTKPCRGRHLAPVVRQAIPGSRRHSPAHDRRPGRAQPRHHRRLDRQQRPGGRLSGGLPGARRDHHHQQAQDPGARSSSPACSRRRSRRARSSSRCRSRSPRKAAYAKFRNPASRYALVGVFVAKRGSRRPRRRDRRRRERRVPRARAGGGAEEALRAEVAGRRHDPARPGINGDIHATPNTAPTSSA